MKLTIGNKQIDIVAQTKVAFWAYIVLIIALTILWAFSPTQKGFSFISLLFVVCISLIGLYSLNCMVVGECNVLAWAVTGLLILEVFILCIAALMIMKSNVRMKAK
jgi:hypothetical protein